MKFFIALCLIITAFLQSFAAPYNTYEEDGKIGLKDQDGQVVIPAKYESLGWSEGSFSLIGNVTGYKLNGLWGIINLSNQRLTPAEFIDFKKGNETMIIATKRSPLTFRTTTGCLSASGKVVIPFDYTGIKLTDLRAIVFIRDGGVFKYGVIDFQNKTRIPVNYKSIEPLGSLRFKVENFEGKFAIYSESGKAITPFDIENIGPFKNNHAVYTEKGLNGLINRDGEIVYPAEFSDIELTPTPRAKKLDEWFVMTCNNNVEKSLQADSVVQVDNNRFKIVQGGLTTLVSALFEKIGDQAYQFIQPFKNGLAIVKMNDKLGVIDASNEQKIPCACDKIYIDTRHVFAGKQVGNKTAWGIYDLTGNNITKKSYDDVRSFNREFFPVLKNGYWGGVDKMGNEILACVYDEIVQSNFQRVVVKFKELYGVIDLNENWIIAPQKNKLELISETRYLEHAADLIYLKSYQNFVYYFTTNPINVTPEGLVEQTTIGAIWTINYDGQIVKRQEAFSEPVEKLFPASEGLRGIKKDGRYGFIDDRARLRIANRYEGIKPFSEGLAAMKILGKWGFINHEEKIVVQPNYDDVTPFSQGYSIVKQQGSDGLINTEGVLILPVRYEAIKVLSGGNLLLTLNGLKGLANGRGNMLIQCKYEEVADLNNSFAIVKLHGKYGVVNMDGISTIPQQYDYMYFNPEADRIVALKRSEWVDLTIK